MTLETYYIAHTQLIPINYYYMVFEIYCLDHSN